MAKLPTARDLGRRPQANVSMPVSQPNTSAVSANRVNTMGAQAVENLGTEMQAADARITRRQDAVERANTITAYETEVRNELRRVQDEEDNSLSQTGLKYGEFREKKTQKLLEGLTSSPEGRAQIELDMAGINAKYGDLQAVMSITAGRQKVSDTQDSFMRSAANEVSENPSMVFDKLAETEKFIDGFADAQDTATTRAKKLNAATALFQTSINGALSRSDHKSATLLLEKMDALGYTDVFEPGIKAAIQGRINTLQMADSAHDREVARKVAAHKEILGFDPTPETRIKYEGAAPAATSANKKTVLAKVQELDDAKFAKTGKHLTDKEWAKGAGYYIKEDEGDLTEEERARTGFEVGEKAQNYLAVNSTAFGQGTLSENDDNRYLGAVAELTKPTVSLNPVSGEWETTVPVLPRPVAEALTARGIPIPSGNRQEDFPLGDQAPVPDGGQAPSPNETIWQMKGKLTGPLNTLAGAAQRIPGIGGMLPGAQAAQAQQKVSLLKRDLVTVLQNSPRFANAEREQIEKDINIETNVFDSEAALTNRLIGIDEALDLRMRDLEKQVNNKFLAPDRKQWARTMYIALGNFKDKLAVPPKMTIEEVRKGMADGTLQSGTEVLDVEGELWKVP